MTSHAASARATYTSGQRFSSISCRHSKCSLHRFHFCYMACTSDWRTLYQHFKSFRHSQRFQALLPPPLPRECCPTQHSSSSPFAVLLLNFSWVLGFPPRHAIIFHHSILLHLGLFTNFPSTASYNQSPTNKKKENRPSTSNSFSLVASYPDISSKYVFRFFCLQKRLI